MDLLGFANFTPEALGQADGAYGHGPPPGEPVLMAVFGAGMTWGSALLTWRGARDRPCSPSIPRSDSSSERTLR